MKERRYDIDWLRVMVMLAVFFYHCALFFRSGTWVLNNAERSFAADAFSFWLDMWFMPFFFLLSGFGSWYALQFRSSGQYLLERVKRLLIPVYTVGLFILNLTQCYIHRVDMEMHSGTFWEMLPSYFRGLGSFSFAQPVGNGVFAEPGLMPTPYHSQLWFLQFLFLISLVVLPLLRYLRSEQGLHLIDTLAGWCHRRGGIFLFLIPVLLVRISLKNVALPGLYTWADFLEFLVFFVIGYILPADSRFTESIKKHGWICLILGNISCTVCGLLVLKSGWGEPFSLKFMLIQTVYGIGRWSWIVFFLSLGEKELNVNNKVLAYISEAVLPFYILHHTIIVCVGWFVIRWNMGILPKFLIIVVASFALIMVLYELLVKAFNGVRFLFGMRPKKKPSARPAPHPEGTAA